MKALVITNLFPNNKEPGRGIFNKQQLVELSKVCELRVVAPLPWRPKFVSSIYHEVPHEEGIEKIKVYHPRYLVTPKVGRRFYGRFFYQGTIKLIEKIYEEFQFDVIFATWGYPDVYGASLVAKKLQKPLVSRVHGTDINVIGKSPYPRQMMKEAFDYSSRVVANSSGLKKGVCEMGIDPRKVVIIQNGVDKNLFRPLNKEECRQKLNLNNSRQHIVYIGNLVLIKGVEYLIGAMKSLPAEILLHIVGSGELEQNLRTEVAKLSLEKNVIFHGRKPHAELPIWLNAADVLCLPSLNEGSPNVVIEALSCGTPVVGSAVGGVVDLIDSKSKGRLFPAKDMPAMATAIKEVLEQVNNQMKPEFKAISWQENANQLYTLLQEAIAK